MSRVLSTSTSLTNFQAALKSYKRQTKKDIASHPLAARLKSCDSSSAILTVLRNQVQMSGQSQNADEKWTKWLNPTVNVLYAFSAALGIDVGLAFPPANAIFTGIGVLLQVVKHVGASQDTLVDLFGYMGSFFEQLGKYIKVRPIADVKDIIIQIMAEVILILGIVTKEIGQGRIKKYLRKLSGRPSGKNDTKNDIKNALERLDTLMSRMKAIPTGRRTGLLGGIIGVFASHTRR